MSYTFGSFDPDTFNLFDREDDANLFGAIHAKLPLNIPAFDIAAYMVADTYAKRTAEVAALCARDGVA